MKYIKVREAGAESAKRKLMQSMLFDRQRSVKHSLSYVYFPILDISEGRIKKLFSPDDVEVVGARERVIGGKGAAMDFGSALKKILSKAELGKVSTGYDILGNIAVVDTGGIGRGKEREVAKAIISSHPSVSTVIAKAGAVSGVYRKRKYRYVAGKRSYIADYRENGCAFRFDVRKTFFSNRLSYERSRIMGCSGDGENVMVMFAGVGPFAIELGKRNRRSKVIGIELNREACRYMRENIALNGLDNVTAVGGDVRRVSKKYAGFADRIVMPLPKASMRFLDEALLVAKDRAMVHIYAFGPAESAFRDVESEIKRHSRENGYSARVVFKRVVRTYSPAEIEVVLDYAIAKKRRL